MPFRLNSQENHGGTCRHLSPRTRVGFCNIKINGFKPRGSACTFCLSGERPVFMRAAVKCEVGVHSHVQKARTRPRSASGCVDGHLLRGSDMGGGHSAFPRIATAQLGNGLGHAH